MAEVDLGKLSEAMHNDRLRLRRWREERREATRQYIGRHWSTEGPHDRVPMNLLSLYCQIMLRTLVGKNPRSLWSTFQRQHRPMINAQQEACNKDLVRMRFAKTMKRVALDAFFTVGIAKVAIADPTHAASVNWNLSAGSPFIERVDFDDWVHDGHGRDFESMNYMGHRFRVPLDVIKDSKIFSKERLKLEPSYDQRYNLEGDERISVLGRGYYAGDADEVDPMIDLWEIYLPRHRLVITFAGDYPQSEGNYSAKPLRVQRWLGPDSGPYHFLGFMDVPGNAMPKAPIQDLQDLHEVDNHLWRKLMRQAERQKNLLLYGSGAAEDAQRVVDANDGDAVPVNNVQAFQQVDFGGPNQGNFILADKLMNVFSFMAGNLNLQGGLAPQSKTAHQDEMLNANAGITVSDMQGTMLDFASEVLGAYGWYLWHDPFRVMKSTYSVPGVPDATILRQVTPAQRKQVRWEDVEVMIDMYSMQHQTPQTRLAQMNSLIDRCIPLMPMLQQQGIGLNMSKYLEKAAKYMDDPDIEEIFSFTPTPAQEAPAPPDSPKMPQNTKRTYERVSRPSGTQAAAHDDLRQQLIGAQDFANGTKTNGFSGAR